MNKTTLNSQKEKYSMLSLRRATAALKVHYLEKPMISIHALLAESDANIETPKTEEENFYPRSPCGERLNKMAAEAQIPTFLSTLSLRRATRIHAL